VIDAKDISATWDKLDKGADNDGSRYVIDIRKSLENI